MKIRGCKRIIYLNWVFLSATYVTTSKVAALFLDLPFCPVYFSSTSHNNLNLLTFLFIVLYNWPRKHVLGSILSKFSILVPYNWVFTCALLHICLDIYLHLLKSKFILKFYVMRYTPYQNIQ